MCTVWLLVEFSSVSQSLRIGMMSKAFLWSTNALWVSIFSTELFSIINLRQNALCVHEPLLRKSFCWLDLVISFYTLKSLWYYWDSSRIVGTHKISAIFHSFGTGSLLFHWFMKYVSLFVPFLPFESNRCFSMLSIIVSVNSFLKCFLECLYESLISYWIL